MKKLLIGAGVLAAILIIVVMALKNRKLSGENVYAGEVTRGDIVTVVSGTGVIQPRTKVNISSEVYGQIVEMGVREGQTVAKGDLLIRIDPDKYRSETDRLSANVRVNSIAIESEEVGLKNLVIDQKRAHDLYAQGVLSHSELERADLAVDTSLIRLKSLKESVTQAEAALSRAKDDLGKTTIYAPMSGKVTQVNSEAGEQVIVGTTNIPGSVIMVISDMSEVLAEVNVDETVIVKLKPGQRALVTADAVEKTTYEGRVTEIRNTAKKEGDVNVFGVKIILTNADERLRPGMTAKAKIETERRQNVLRIPIQAVTTRERKKLAEESKSGSAALAHAPAAGASGAKGGEKAKSATTAGASNAEGNAKAEKVTNTADASHAGPAGSDSDSTAGSQAAGKTSTATAKASRPGASDSDSTSGSQAAGKKATATTDDSRSGGSGSKSASAAAPAASGRGAGDRAGAEKSDRDELEVSYRIVNDIARVVPVKTGASDEKFVEVLDGLEEGETIVKGPYRVLKRLKDGDRVIKQDESEATGEGGDKSGGSDSDAI